MPSTNTKQEEIEALGLDPEKFPDGDVSLKDDSDCPGRSRYGQLLYDAFGQDIEDRPKHLNIQFKENRGWRGDGYNGVRLSAKWGSQYGEKSHRAIRSTTFSARKFREKFLEMSAEARRQDKKDKAQQERRKRNRKKKEQVAEDLDAIKKELGLKGPVSGRARSTDRLAKAKAKANGIELTMNELSAEETRMFFSALENVEKLDRALEYLTQLINIAQMDAGNRDKMNAAEVQDMAEDARKKLNQFVGRAK